MFFLPLSHRHLLRMPDFLRFDNYIITSMLWEVRGWSWGANFSADNIVWWNTYFCRIVGWWNLSVLVFKISLFKLPRTLKLQNHRILLHEICLGSTILQSTFLLFQLDVSKTYLYVLSPTGGGNTLLRAASGDQPLVHISDRLITNDDKGNNWWAIDFFCLLFWWCFLIFQSSQL